MFQIEKIGQKYNSITDFVYIKFFISTSENKNEDKTLSTYLAYKSSFALFAMPIANRFYDAEISDSVAKIVSCPRGKSSKGALENLLSDKTKSLKATVKALLEEISLREDMNSNLLSKMDGAISRQNSFRENLATADFFYTPELKKDVHNIKAGVEGNILELEKEKRAEGLECWRDLMNLKRYLMVSLKEYWEAVRKREMLNGKESVTPAVETFLRNGE